MNFRNSRCVDIDECAARTHECPSNAKCVNINDRNIVLGHFGYECLCLEGYMKYGDGDSCEDAEECLQGIWASGHLSKVSYISNNFKNGMTVTKMRCASIRWAVSR